MRGFNQVIMLGNVTRDVECKVSPKGIEYAQFNVAINESYKDKTGNKVEKTEFINVVAFGQSAKIAGNYLRKGSPVFIQGSLHITKKQSQTGEDREYASVKVDKLELLPSGDGRKSASTNTNESLDSYFPKDTATSNRGGEYANRPFPGSITNSAPESLSEEFMGINQQQDISFNFGANASNVSEPWDRG